MKTYFLTLLLSSFIFVSVNGQNKEKKQTTQDILMSCNWERLPENCEHGYAQEDEYFSRDTAYVYTYYDCYTDRSMRRGKEPWGRLYYFSNTLDKEFDKSKVGKLTDGKYIIKDYLFEPQVDEVLKVSDKRIDFREIKLRGTSFRYALTFKPGKHGFRDEKAIPNDCTRWCCVPHRM